MSKTIWDEIKKQEPNNLEQIIERMVGLDDPSFPQCPDYKLSADQFMKAQEKYSCDLDRAATKKAKEFLKENANKAIYIFEFGDHETYECALEHGNLFINLKHIVISHH